MVFFLIFFSLALFALAWKRFDMAVGFFALILPIYLVRFTIPAPAFLATRHIPGLPSTLLELSFGILFLAWIVRFWREDFLTIKTWVKANKLFFVLYCLFLAASIVSIFVSDMWWYSLGQWRAYFLEPMILFLILVARFSKSEPTRDTGKKTLVWGLLASSVAISVFGIVQLFTGWHIGNADLMALTTHRITSLFLSPNSVALYLVPVTLLVFMMFGLIQTDSRFSKKPLLLASITIALLNLVAIFFTRSVGGWFALFAGGLVFGWLRGYKKICVALLACLALLAVAIFMGGRFVGSKTQSASNRLTLWKYSEEFLTASPKNFILGGGVGQFFRKVQKPHYNVKEMERLIYPHNIVLNFWIETGLVGAMAIGGIVVYLVAISRRILKQNELVGAGLLAALTAFVVHGLIDVPYFKNDLAMFFWILAALVFISYIPPSKESV